MMTKVFQTRPLAVRTSTAPGRKWLLVAGLMSAAACAPAGTSMQANTPEPMGSMSATPPRPDPRIGLRAGVMDAEQATWNMRVVSTTPSPGKFAGSTNSDLAFTGNYVIQGNYNGFMVWDVSNPNRPTLVKDYFCPASQSDVSVYKNLLFVSGEGLGGRLDCGDQGVQDTVSTDRLRGLRIFDITDIRNPRYLTNVQTCRGSHTHTVLADPQDTQNVYVYISGSAPVRSPNELPGCVAAAPEQDPNSALFRIEVIKVPLANPERAAIVSSPRIFTGLQAPPRHGETPTDIAAARERAAAARAQGMFTGTIQGMERVLSPRFIQPLLDSVVTARGATGPATRADSAALRAALPDIIAQLVGSDDDATGPTQCHDITVYPAIGLAGGACGGYGLLLDIRNPAQPIRIDAAADSNFSYWHSATFNNEGTKMLFSDEWGGGGQAKCRATDPMEWGANAIFTIENRKLNFQSYYKLPVAQTEEENCVAHNGSLIPVPGRDVMVQSWYQGGVSVFDWTDAANPMEIAFFDRGPADSTQMGSGGTWSAYWYNGNIYSSEIARGLDVLALTPGPLLTQNEIDAAKTVRLDYLNTQGQPRFVWPTTFALARAYVDQIARSNSLDAGMIADVRQTLDRADGASGGQQRDMLTSLATQLDAAAARSADAVKVRMLAGTVRELATAAR